MKCEGCGDQILEGMHYMKVRVELATHWPESSLAAIVDEHEATTFDLIVHHPGCFALWARKHPIIVDVFADVGRH